jgi:DNA-binding transcriptional regulator YiaG
MTRSRKCPECGGKLVGRAVKHVEKVGPATVTDGTGVVSVCEACGEYDLSAEQLSGYERRAAALVLRDGAHVDGQVVRYARKALGLRQEELATLLACRGETVSRWETEAIEIPRTEQLALVALLDGVECGQLDPADALERAKQDKPRKGPAQLEVLPRTRAA